MLVSSPLSVFAEAIRKVRVAVDQAIDRNAPGFADRRGAVVLVTSTAPHEGKTTTSLALARAYAMSGKTALLVDCDLRKPSLHTQVGKEPSTGLIDYLGDPSEPPPLRSIITVDKYSGVAMLVGSRRSDRPTDQLVAGRRFNQLIDAATKSFDIVILDTPPVGPVVDALYLAEFADAVLFIVQWASTAQPEVKAAVRSVLDSLRPGIEIVSVINQGVTSRGSYSGKYAYYYSES